MHTVGVFHYALTTSLAPSKLNPSTSTSVSDAFNIFNVTSAVDLLVIIGGCWTTTTVCWVELPANELLGGVVLDFGSGMPALSKLFFLRPLWIWVLYSFDEGSVVTCWNLSSLLVKGILTLFYPWYAQIFFLNPPQTFLWNFWASQFHLHSIWC